MNTLEKLCRPLIHSLCEYWQLSHAGTELDPEAVTRDLRNQLSEIRLKVEDDPILKREFSRIEQPLVFFIDYTIKEGHFKFSQNWNEIARDYDELSGDEKFFDMLSDTLDDPESAEQLMLYYLFMGLGFDGCQTKHDFIERRMKLCATRFPAQFTSVDSALAGEDVLTHPKFRAAVPHRLFTVYSFLALVFLLMCAALYWNIHRFSSETESFRQTLENAVESARWKIVYPDASKNGKKLPEKEPVPVETNQTLSRTPGSK